MQLSTKRDEGITIACVDRSSPDCHALVRLAIEHGNDVFFGNDGHAYVYPEGTPTVSNIKRPNNPFQDAVAQGVVELVIGELLASGAVMIGRTVVGGTTTLLGLGAQGWNKIRPLFAGSG